LLKVGWGVDAIVIIIIIIIITNILQ